MILVQGGMAIVGTRVRQALVSLRMGNKNSLTFVRLISWMFVIALLPILTITVISYVQVSQTFRAEAEQTSRQYVGQTMNALEIIVGQIMDSCRQLTLNPTFRRFEYFPNGDYYESLTGELPPQDLPELYRYFTEKERAMDSVSMFLLSNRFIDSLYFYDSGKNKVLAFGGRSAAGVFYDFGKFYDQAWRSSLQQQELPAPLILDSRQARQQDGSVKNVLTVIMPTGTNDDAFIVNLNEAQLYKEVLNRLSGAGTIYLLSHQGRIILHEQGEPSNSSIQAYLGREAERIDYGGSGSFNLVIGGVPSLAVYASSDWMKWTVLHVMPLEGLNRSLRVLKQAITYTGLIVLLIAGAMAYLSSKRLYQPVKKTMEERDLYRLRWEESLPVYQERFTQSLLRPNKYSKEEVDAQIAQLRIPIGSGPYEVILLELEPAPAQGAEAALELEVVRLRLQELTEAAAAGLEGFSVWVGDYRLARVLSRSGQAEPVAQTVVDGLRQAAMPSSFRAIRIGVGGGCSDVSELPKAYTAAREDLLRSVNEQPSGADPMGEFSFPQAKAELLCDYIRVGNAEQALHVLQTLHVELRDRVGSRAEAHRALWVQLLSFVLSTVYGPPPKKERVLEREESLYREILECPDSGSMIGWFKRFVGQASDDHSDPEQGTGAHPHHVDRILHIMESNVAADISLSSVAESLGLNPAYVSRLFKQATGQTFMEYMTAIRIEKSKLLLVRTELKIREVGRQVGYNQDYYFIRLFKDHTGVTPGEYRKKMRGS